MFIEQEFLNNKRNRVVTETSNNLSIFCNEKLTFEDQIEFSSKNVKSSNLLFNKDPSQKSSGCEKKSKTTLDYFITKTNLSNSQTTITSTQNSKNAKINTYFPTTLNQMDQSVEGLQKQLFAWKEKCEKLEIEKERIIKDYNDKKRLYDKELDKLMEENSETKENLMALNTQKEQTELQLKVTQKSLVKYLRDLEENKRKEKKRWLHETGYKVYRQSLQRMTTNKIVDMWEDGEDILNIRKRLVDIFNEKSALEKDLNKLRKLSQIKENNEVARYEQDDKTMLILYRMNRLHNVYFR